MSTKFTSEQIEEARRNNRIYAQMLWYAPRRVTKQVRVDMRAWRLVKAQAREEGITISKLMDKLIQEGIRRRKNPTNTGHAS